MIATYRAAKAKMMRAPETVSGDLLIDYFLHQDSKQSRVEFCVPRRFDY